jgi:hypothetical protein
MLERSEGVGEMRENFLRRKCGVGVQQIVDEQDGGAVLSGKNFANFDLLGNFATAMPADAKKGTMIMSQMHSLCIFKDDY